MSAFSDRLSTKSLASISGPPAARTGAPGELNCTDCHNAATGSGQFTVTGPTNYVAGQTYPITVRHVTADTTRKRWGFELTALANNSSVGTFQSTTTTRIVTGGPGGARQYIEHNQSGTFANQGNGATWTFNWVAPATNVGPITFYAAGIQANNNGSESGDQTYTTTTISQPQTTVAATHTIADFDGDGRTDPSTIRGQNSTAIWNINTATGTSSRPFGLMSDQFVPADYDGDGKTDPAVFRTGVWWIWNSATNTVRGEQFGIAGDVPAPGDFDGDGKADICIFRQGEWYWKRSSNSTVAGLRWGIANDQPVVGDYDGDGKSDIGVYRADISNWWILSSLNGSVTAVHDGVPGDIPVPGDYDGDGRTNIAVFRPSQGIWYTSTDITVNYNAVIWGASTDIPVPGDYDGDRKTDVAVYRDGIWFIRLSTNGTLSAQFFGLSGDLPIPSLRTQ